MSPDLVRRLLSAQQPDLARLPIEQIANGWDNVIYRLGADLVRLPRRAAAAALLVHEQQWLSILAPRLPLPIPAPVRIGRPDLGYPWAWSVVSFLPGRVAAQTPPVDTRDAAIRLGKFLGALHRPAPPEAPANPVRGVPLADRHAMMIRNLDALGSLVDRASVMKEWEDALSARAWDEAPVWLHGDLHPANILVDDGRVCAVIDFGDITAGDPATDLCVAWMMLPLADHAAFRTAYRAAIPDAGDDDDRWARARGWALALSIAFLAHSADNPQLADIGRRTLQAIIA